MSSERLRVLKLLEEGKITTDEADRLLNALSGGSASTGVGRTLRIRVWEHGLEKPKVNVSVPMSLVKWGLNFIPESARQRIEEKHVNLDLLAEAIDKDLTGKIVEVDDDDERVEISVE